MAAPPMDALGAFSHLQTNLPAWITRVSELAAHTSARHTEYSEAYRRHTSYKPRRRKNSSVRSIHTDDLVPIAQQQAPPSEAVEASTTTSVPKDDKTPAQQTSRKRRTDEALSAEEDGERLAFVSTRHNVIIEYDGHTQQALEQIVKDIGLARNHIRRGKMSLMPRGNLRANLLNRTANITSQVAAGDQSPISSVCVRSTRTASGLVGVTGTSSGVRKESPFDFADKQLELAHGLCETAAYQVLRSGDCGTELDGVEENFKMLLEMTKTEVIRLEEEKKQKEAEATPEEKEEQARPPQTATAARLARLAALTAGTDKQPSTGTSGAIEVDDDSSISAESLDLSAFRASRIRV